MKIFLRVSDSGFSKIVDGYVVLYREPIKSALAEYHRRRSGYTSFKTKEAFIKAAGGGGDQGFGWRYDRNTEFGLMCVNNSLQSGKPTLIISYEDLVENEISQLLRIAFFLNLTRRPDTIERTLCTIYSEEQIQKLTKRVHRVDLADVAATFVNKTKYINDLKTVDTIINESKLHFIRSREYLLARYNVTNFFS